MKFSLVLALAGASSTLAAPIPLPFLSDFLDKAKDTVLDGVQAVTDPISDLITGGSPENKVATTSVSADELPDFARIAQFARASFCSAPVINQWACGEACEANPDTKPILAGGDDGKIPDFFVAFDPPTNSIVVAHQGTNKKNVDSILNDLDIFFDEPSDIAFPGAKEAGAQLHGGFQDTFNRTSQNVLDFVQAGIADFGATNVLVTGHSLGAAIGQLDTIFLAKHLDPSIKIKTVLFGLPRTGNQEWANFVDKTVQERNIDFQFFINDADPVPKVPPVELGYRHPSGELFQKNNTATGGGIETLRCPGQENENCSTGISLFDSDTSVHNGPYAGVKLGSKSCTL